MPDSVSVIIPAYNAAHHIARAIDSALQQSHPPTEILVIDDGSADDTAAVVERFTAPVRLIRKPNGGPASARNLGAATASGTWLALLDADDWWFPEKLAAQLTYCDAADVGLVHSLPDHRDEAVPPELGFPDLWARNWIINSSAMIRRAAFQELGGFDEARALISVEDYNLWIRLAASHWRILTCPQVLVHYTRGIGISSNFDRFLRASLFNVATLTRQLDLPTDMVERKRSEIQFAFGLQALVQRDMPAARRLLWQSFRGKPSADRAGYLAAATLPRIVLDGRRALTGALRAAERAGSATPAVTTAAAAGWPSTEPMPRASILDTRLHTAAPTDALSPLALIVTVDAEEDFDWTRPFSRDATNVTSMRSQHLAHRIFARYGAKPTYLVDHPVASQDAGRAPLRELLQDQCCDVGAQLHPWVTPPLLEHISPRNSYAGNLPLDLELAKIERLTCDLEDAFLGRPQIFRAGRYGAGPNTGAILRHFGYLVDTSVVPSWSFTDEGGPDFRGFSARPYWTDADCTLLEIPLSAAVVGRCAGWPSRLTGEAFSRRSERLGLPSVLARAGLLERIKLTPEGIAIEEAVRLVRHMAAMGHKVFVLTYHSPSLEPGNTPYVRTTEDRQRFLAWLDEFLGFFTGEMGGTCLTWREVRERLLPSRQAAGRRAP